MSIKLNQDPEMIKVMEEDLMAKAAAAITPYSPTLSAPVHGVFSLDDLENKLESDLCGGIAVGVAYFGARKRTKTEGQNVDRGMSARTLEFRFVLTLAVPTLEACGERHDATKILSVLRMAIAGQSIANSAQRTWDFETENPEISASTKSMLYYSQVWQVAMQNLGSAVTP